MRKSLKTTILSIKREVTDNFGFVEIFGEIYYCWFPNCFCECDKQLKEEILCENKYKNQF